MRIRLPSGTTAELVHPASGPAERGLVVIPDLMGMRPLFDEMVARLAEENSWSVCSFEPYPGQEHLEVSERQTAAAGLTDDRVLGDASAAADATGAATVGVLGFCMGGMYTLKVAASGRFDRHCAFYPQIRVPELWRGSGQGEPLEALEAVDASSVLAIVGCDDSYTPPDDVDGLEATGVTVVRYPGADHGFVHDPTRPAHRAEDAADAWSRVIAWLRG
ncbi:MAG TPA: hypothetical protein EYM46_03575 [Acidimicrobiia bacterium]|jgi:carboxymethylenebutenolidase|nr:hypothetical protein [Acidimicrobiaceae bacterium]HIM65641.1 hypothetical protein [Acidimicrobiia bacterium]